MPSPAREGGDRAAASPDRSGGRVAEHLRIRTVRVGVNSHEVREIWAERSGEYSPDYYAYYGSNGTSDLLLDLLDAHLDPDAAVLELGCSAGRHLARLHEAGYRNLHGVEINDEALDVMAEHYPDLAADAAVRVDAIEDVVSEFEDGRFDAVFSVETLQHIHPDDEWVFAELARVTDDLLITVENEGESKETDVKLINDDFPLYFRDWNRVFTDLGLAQIDVETGVHDRDTLRAFRKVRD